ncbi:hypothetical protein B7Y94_03345 [Candidatus Saccharibacteria bacterium 32-49-12]|nr:MAG: hypothetical protein B7Y94_03345 [Candidatus Saccharibacteria bacterium 32-49-12]
MPETPKDVAFEKPESNNIESEIINQPIISSELVRNVFAEVGDLYESHRVEALLVDTVDRYGTTLKPMLDENRVALDHLSRQLKTGAEVEPDIIDEIQEQLIRTRRQIVDCKDEIIYARPRQVGLAESIEDVVTRASHQVEPGSVEYEELGLAFRDIHDINSEILLAIRQNVISSEEVESKLTTALHLLEQMPRNRTDIETHGGLVSSALHQLEDSINDNEQHQAKLLTNISRLKQLIVKFGN